MLLAVALLKDTNGVIDIDPPVWGTIDDPPFPVFGLIVQVIVNPLAKAAAPFALLGAIAGGGEALARDALKRTLIATKVMAQAGKPDAPLSVDAVTIAAEKRPQRIAAA